MRGKLTGIVLCGGRSSRMGYDKGLTVYHALPQRYHVYEMLEGLCSAVYLSCNQAQVHEIPAPYRYIEDDKNFADAGPLTAVLTAMKSFPGSDLLVVGCDYPFLSREALKDFTDTISDTHRPAAFYDLVAGCYVPVIAFYPFGSEASLMKCKDDPKYSLQQFLKEKQASKYIPRDMSSVIKVDDADSAARVREQLLNAVK